MKAVPWEKIQSSETSGTVYAKKQNKISSATLRQVTGASFFMLITYLPLLFVYG
jgi:hypothetical protein